MSRRCSTSGRNANRQSPPSELFRLMSATFGQRSIQNPIDRFRNMAGVECTEFLEKEKTSKSLKSHLNEWKEIIVILNLIMKYDEIWFPAIIVTCVTSFYLYVWLVNCSILNVIWMIGLCVTLIDCIVCGPVQKILPSNSWDQENEHVFTAITDSITKFWDLFTLYIERFIQLRLTNRILFHSILTVSFFSLLYIGTTFNNLFISYITGTYTL